MSNSINVVNVTIDGYPDPSNTDIHDFAIAAENVGADIDEIEYLGSKLKLTMSFDDHPTLAEFEELKNSFESGVHQIEEDEDGDPLAGLSFDWEIQ